MRNGYADEDLGPVVSKRDMPMPSNFVTPAPLATRQPPQVVDAPAWLVQQRKEAAKDIDPLDTYTGESATPLLDSTTDCRFVER